MATKETAAFAKRAAQAWDGCVHCLLTSVDIEAGSVLKTYVWLKRGVKVGQSVRMNGIDWEVEGVFQ